MKKIISIIIAFALMPLLANAKWDKVKIGTEGAYLPWNGQDASGAPIGAEIDMINDICDRMGVECEIVFNDWDGIIPSLLNKKYDVIIAGMSITDERKEKVDFSIGYMTDGACIVVSDNSPLTEFSPAKESINLYNSDATTNQVLGAVVGILGNAKVGVQGGTIHQNFVDQYLPNSDSRAYGTQDELNLDLAAGRIDAGLADCGAFEDFLSKTEGKGLTIIKPILSGGPFGEGVGAAFRQDDDDLREMFNEAISSFLADGSCSAVSKNWFSNAVTGEPKDICM